MSKYAIENEPTYCSILNGKCPEKTDGERTYCNYYCQLYTVYADYERRSKELECRADMRVQSIRGLEYRYLKSLPNCPKCGEVNLQRENEYGNVVENYSHCPDCGQAISWEEEE